MNLDKPAPSTDAEAPEPAPAPAPVAEPTPPPTPPARTRSGAIWVGAITASVILVLLLVFILQNSQRVDVSYFGAHGHLALGVALLLAAASGVLLVAIPGSARIWQLRRRALRAESTTTVPPQPQRAPQGRGEPRETEGAAPHPDTDGSSPSPAP